MKYFLLFLIFTASCLNAINFKEGNKTFPYYLWFGGGIGIITTESLSKTCMKLSINFSKGHHILKLRGVGSVGFQVTAFDEGASDIGLLYGYRHSFENISISYLAGAGIATGTYQGKNISDYSVPYEKYEMIDYQTIGIPLEVQIDMNALRPLGLSVSLFGDLNTEKSFIGFTANILIGRLP